MHHYRALHHSVRHRQTVHDLIHVQKHSTVKVLNDCTDAAAVSVVDATEVSHRNEAQNGERRNR